MNDNDENVDSNNLLPSENMNTSEPTYDGIFCNPLYHCLSVLKMLV